MNRTDYTRQNGYRKAQEEILLYTLMAIIGVLTQIISSTFGSHQWLISAFVLHLSIFHILKKIRIVFWVLFIPHIALYYEIAPQSYQFSLIILLTLIPYILYRITGHLLLSTLFIASLFSLIWLMPKAIFLGFMFYNRAVSYMIEVLI